MKKAIISALLWALAVEACFFAVKFWIYPGVSTLGVQIGVVLTTIAEFMITLKKQKR